MKDNAITIQTTVNAPIEKVWECWTRPEHITGWAFAADDWEAKDPENNVREGGSFKTTMAAKDGSASFDFTGVYDSIKAHELIAYTMTDGRQVRTVFEGTPEGVHIVQVFDPEDENPLDMQQEGWQAILDNFKKYTENAV